MMRTGAFAMLDCLGFKGIWNKTKPETVLEKLKTAASKKQEIIKVLFDDLPVKAEVIFLSDTVVIGVSLPNPPACDEEKGMLVWCASRIAYEYANEFRQGNVPLVFRGCIGFGEFVIEENFILGPIVDEVASHMSVAEGAFIWALPEASEFVSAVGFSKKIEINPDQILISNVRVREKYGEQAATILKEKLNQTDWGDLEILRPLIKKINEKNIYLIPNYPMPIKGGGVLRCTQVNPFPMESCEHDRVVSEYLGAMKSNAIEVIVKKQNTEAFLQVARNIREEFDQTLNKIFNIVDVYMKENPIK